MSGMKCKLVGFMDQRGQPINNISPSLPKFMVVLALIERRDKHPKLGEPKPGKLTVTSRVKYISKEGGYFITQNSIYDYAGQH